MAYVDDKSMNKICAILTQVVVIICAGRRNASQIWMLASETQ